MPSTYSSSLRLELMAQGENANTWGNKTNTNLDKVEQAIAGYRSVNIAGGSSVYLSVVNASAPADSPGRNAFIVLTGALTSAISVIIPDAAKGYWIRNNATGASVTFRTSSGTGFNLPGGYWLFAISDGTTVVNTESNNLYAQLSAANTFTNLNTFGGAAVFSSTVDVSATTTFYDKEVVRPLFKDYALVHKVLTTVSGTVSIDLTLGNYFSAYIAGSSTFVFSNPPSSPNAGGFILELTNGGAHTVAWPAQVKWNNGNTPILTTAGIDIIVFITDNGGTLWIGNRPIGGVL